MMSSGRIISLANENRGKRRGWKISSSWFQGEEIVELTRSTPVKDLWLETCYSRSFRGVFCSFLCSKDCYTFSMELQMWRIQWGSRQPTRWSYYNTWPYTGLSGRSRIRSLCKWRECVRKCLCDSVTISLISPDLLLTSRELISPNFTFSSVPMVIPETSCLTDNLLPNSSWLCESQQTHAYSEKSKVQIESLEPLLLPWSASVSECSQQ